jgi:GMP synthase (glutamine-hydrolysing)
MSHADTILELTKGFELLATTESIPIAAFKKEWRSQRVNSQLSNSQPATHDSLPPPRFPALRSAVPSEVYHSTEGKKVLYIFLVNSAVAARIGQLLISSVIPLQH